MIKTYVANLLLSIFMSRSGCLDSKDGWRVAISSMNTNSATLAMRVVVVVEVQEVLIDTEDTVEVIVPGNTVVVEVDVIIVEELEIDVEVAVAVEVIVVVVVLPIPILLNKFAKN